ncbi:MAG: autotransporter-associated beta strand repeat-containing protein [Verrucomicrobiaceae bacterium]|nr:autotransporter-associated beta strand repeat-containing protein [Verrucomicrobiaceae bacterium]
MKTNHILRLIGFSLTLLAVTGWSQTVGQWNTNNSATWMNGTNWINGSVPNGIGSNVKINQDFSPGRMIGDMVQTATMTANITTAQTVTLTATPLAGSIGVTDGTFFWSQARGSSTTAWTVSFNSGTNVLSVTYNPAITAARTLTVAYGVADIVQTATMTSAAGTTAQLVTLSKTPISGTISASDGTLSWTEAGGSSSSAWTVSYNSSTNQLSVTYNPALVSNRTLNITFATAIVGAVTELMGVTQRIGVTNNSATAFTSTALTYVPNTSQMGVTDGVYTWTPSGGSSNPAKFNVTYDSGSRILTATYTTLADAPSLGRNIVVAYWPQGIPGNPTLTVSTADPLISFSRNMQGVPVYDANFKVQDGVFTATSNTSGVLTLTTGSATNYAVTHAAPNVLVNYRTVSALNGISTGKTIVAVYTTRTTAMKNVTVGNLLIGDISGADRVDLRLNSLTFDNGGINNLAQLNKIAGGPDEIAAKTNLSSSLALAVRTGGDVINKNAFLLSGDISGAGSLIKMDSGNVVLQGNNTFTGSTIIRNTGGFTFLNNTTGGSALSSSDIFLGTASRDGHSAMVLQLASNTNLATAGTVSTNQIADTSRLWFDGASGRNAYLRMFGTAETVGGIADSTGQGVIENTEGENTIAASSVLTVNTANAADNFLYNGFFRNKAGGDSTGTISLVKSGAGKLTLQGGNINYGPTAAANISTDPLANNATTVSGGTLALVNTTNFGSNVINNSTLEFGTAGDWTFNRSVSGTGNVVKTGPNVTALAANNVYQGSTTIEGGTLRVTYQLFTEGMGSTNGSTTVFKRTLNRVPEPGSIRVTDGTVTAFLGTPKDGLTVTYNSGTREITATYASAPPAGRTVNAQYVLGGAGTGSLSSTSAINILTGTLHLVNDQNNNVFDNAVGGIAGRVSDAAPINSNGGTINFDTKKIDATNYAETLGALNLQAGRTNVTITTGTIADTTDTGKNSNATLTFSNLTRQAKSTVTFIGNTLGVAQTDAINNKITFTTAPTLIGGPTNGIIGGWAIATTFDKTGANAVYDFATYSGGTVRGLAASAYRTGVSGAVWAATDNMRINGFAPTISQGAVNSQTTVNSIKFDDTTGRTLAINARGLVVNSGGILARGTTHVIQQSAGTTGYLTAGSGNNYELDFWVENTRRLNVVSPIRDNGANAVKVVKSGPGKMILGGAYTVSAPAFSGGLVINEGIVEVSTFSPLGRNLLAGNLVQDYLTMNGGLLQVQNKSGVEKTVAFESQYGITLGKAGGRFATDPNMTFLIKSKITGEGGLTMGDTGVLDGASGGILDVRGQNDFQGGVTVNFGKMILGGSVLPEGGSVAVPASNTFKGPITINGGTFSLRTGSALPTSLPNIVSAGAGTLELMDSGNFGSLSGDGTITTATDSLAGSPAAAERVLKITQDTNTTYNGILSDSDGPVLSIEKRGKGVLSLGAETSTYHGSTRILEGVLQVSKLATRGPADRFSDGQGGYSGSSIGMGNYDKDIAGGTALLTLDKRAGDNLFIASGAALSHAAGFPQYTDRAFTIGVGAEGAGVLANSSSTGAALTWMNRPLRDTNGVATGDYDGILFSEANKAATLNLGGRNQGLNIFGMDLHDNGSASLNLQKSGDGQWILGDYQFSTGAIAGGMSRSDFTGRTTIYQGTLGLAQDGVLGAAGGEAVSLVGGNLDLRSLDYTVNEGLNMAGGRVRALVGTNNAWTGQISVDVPNSVIEVGTGAALRVRGAITGKGNLLKQNFGTLILEGNNTISGGLSVQEGILRLDYSNNPGSKLSDTGGVALGGGRQGGVIDVVGGTSIASPIIETVAALNLGLGLNRLTRSDATSTTMVRLNALENARVGQGAALDIAANNIAQTDRLNDSTGLLGTWLTVGKSDWAKNNGTGVSPPAAGTTDGYITGLTSYANDVWGGASTNTNLTTSGSVSNGVTNTLRFATPADITLTLSGVNKVMSDGILQAPSVAGKSNIITGGAISLQDNGFGGNLMIHQHDTLGNLTIESAITDAVSFTPVTGTMYEGNVGVVSPNTAVRFKAASGAAVSTLVPGMLVTGSQIEPNTVITAVDYTTGEVTLNQGRTAEVGITITVNGVTFTGDVLVRVTPTARRFVRLTAGNFALLANGQAISGGSIPPGAVVSSFAPDAVNPSHMLITIGSDIQVPSAIPSFTLSPIQTVKGQMYFNAQTNRLRVTPASGIAGISVGMVVSGTNIEPGTTISSIDFFNGDVFLSQGPIAQVDTTLTIDGISRTCDTMALGAQNRIRMKTGATFDAVNGLVTYPVVGMTISGGTIPAGTTITGVAIDPVYPGAALLTISQNIPVPAVIGGYALSFNSRNGVAKFGDGTIVLSGASTYTGATYITGGKINVKALTNAGVAGPLGAATSAAGNIVLSGGTLGYIGDSASTDRGFQINEIGTVEVARKGAVATFTGNLSGGVGAAQGVMQVSGAGTVKVSHTGGNVSNSGTPLLPALGGSTNIGGFSVKGGNLLLSYDNPNSNNNANRFAASNASLTMAGGKFELSGLEDVEVPSGSNPSENRTQQLFGQLTLQPGASEIWVTGKRDSVTSLALQDPNNPTDVVRAPGATVLLVENPTDGVADMFLAIKAVNQSAVLPWATYRDTSILNRRGINDFAAVETLNDSVINADSKDLYKLGSDVANWTTNATMSEFGTAGFGDSTAAISQGRTPESYSQTETNARVYALRFFAPVAGTVSVTDRLTLTGGAILVGSEVIGGTKIIKDGELTAGTGFEAQNPWNNGDGTTDLLIHNYNGSREFTIASKIVDNHATSLELPNGASSLAVNLVQGGWGTTYLTAENTYSGTTFVNNGVLRLGSANAIPGGIGVVGGASGISLNGGMIGLEHDDLTRSLGTGISQLQFTGGGGFAAYRSPGDTSTTPVVREVNFGGAGAPVIWGANGFVPGGQTLRLGSADGDATVRLVNPVDLVGGYRQISVADSKAAIDAELAGTLRGSGGVLAKLGQGTLALSAGNLHTGGTIVGQGTLIVSGSVVSSVAVSSVDATQTGDSVTLQVDGATMNAGISIGNKNSTGISTIKVTGNSSAAGGIELGRQVYVDALAGRSFNVSGPVTGSGRITVNDGGTLGLSGNSTFGGTGSSSGVAIDGAVVVRNGSVEVGHTNGLGVANIELGDSVSSLPMIVVDRSTNGRSLLEVSGEWDPTSNGTPGDISGSGAFIYPNQNTITIDGKVYTKTDASLGTRILVNGEIDFPERNGVYEVRYHDGITSALTDDTISLTRVGELNDARELAYGRRVQVSTGTDAGKVFFMATGQPASLPAPDLYGRVLITTAVLWKQETTLAPNLALLASGNGIQVANSIDINSTNGAGTTTLGGATSFTAGSAAFTGTVTLQSMAAAAEARQVRLVSESLIGKGVEFTGVISEAEANDTLSLVKLGSGIVTLSGSNTFKGGTEINAGTLFVNTSIGSGTGSGSVTAANFGTVLGGNGTISGATTLLGGASLQPGDSNSFGGADQMHFLSSLTFGADTSAVFQLASPAAWDRVSITGLLSVDSSALFSVLLGFTPNLLPGESLTFDLLDWGSLAAIGSLADRLDLPALATPDFYWDTSSFNATGAITYAQRNLTSTPPVHFSIKEGTISENGGSVTIAVELDWAPASDVTVPLVFSSGAGIATMGASADYTVSATSLTFSANDGERSKTLTITVRDDAMTESTERAVISLNAATKTAPSTFSLSILDNDGALPVGDRWVLRNPMVTNEALKSVGSLAGTFIAVGTHGTILKSSDATIWTRVNLAAATDINALASNGTILVAVGKEGRVLTTTDGTNWVIRSVGGSLELTQVSWTGARFVAVGADGITYTSSNGEVWNYANSGVLGDLFGVSSATGQIVAVGEGGVIILSTNNGVSWTAQTSPTATTLRSVAHDGVNTYVAVGDAGVVVTSTNGTDWTAGTAGVSAGLRSVRWDGAAFVVSGLGGTVLTSPSGATGTWTVRTTGVSDDLSDAAKLGSVYVAVGSAGAITNSTDAAAWTKVSSGDTDHLRGVAASGSQLIAVGNNGSILTSTDALLGTTVAPALSWSVQTSPIVLPLNAVAATSLMRVAVGNAGSAISSPDGVNWTSIPTGTGSHLNGIAVKGSRFCAVGDQGAVFTSDNGLAWTERTSLAFVENLKAVAASTSIFVAVGANGSVRTSSDGVTWTSVDLGTTATFNAVAWTGSKFVTVGNGGLVFISSNGTSWTQRTSGVTASLTGVAGSGNVIIAVGGNGAATQSNDSGTTWSKRDTGTGVALKGLAVSAAGRFVATGDSGTVLTSESKAPPAPAVFFASTADSVSEAVGTWNVPVMLNPVAGAAVSVPFTVRTLGTTALKTTDYTIVTASPLKFLPGETLKNIVITIKNDAVLEAANETVIIDLGTPTGVAGVVKVDPTAYTLTILDEYLAPSITPLGTQSQFVIIGGGSPVPLDLNVTPAGSLALKVQWQKNLVNLGTPVTVTSGVPVHYTVSNMTLTNAGKYGAKVINPLSPLGLATSTVAEVVVVERLPQQLKLGKAGTSVTLTANAAGATALQYRWFRGINPILVDDANFAGTGTKTLTIKTFAPDEQDLYKCRITSPAVSGEEFSTTFDVVVAAMPDITPLATPAVYPVGRVGAAYNGAGYQIPRASSDKDKTPVTWNVTGLPPGLVADKNTGFISGVPTTKGSYKVNVSATNPFGTTVISSAYMTIDGVPDNALGTFVALADRTGSHLTNNGSFGLGARIDITTAVNGTFSGKLTTVGTAISFVNGKLNTANAAAPTGTIGIVRTGKTTLTLNFTIDTATNLLTGTLTDTTPTSAAIAGWRNTWTTTNKPITTTLPAVHNFVAVIPSTLEGDALHPDIPQGDTYASASVASTGVVTIAGRLADGTVLTGSAPLGPKNPNIGKALIYQGLYIAPTTVAGSGNPGSLHGFVDIDFTGQRPVTGTLTWSRAAQPSTGATAPKFYRDGFEPISLEVSGGLYTPPLATLDTGIILGAKAAAGNNAAVTFFDTNGLLVTPTTTPASNPNLGSFRINSLATPVGLPTGSTLKMTFVTSTGLISGSFVLVDASGVKRTVPYYAMVIPDASTAPMVTDGIGAGSFMLPGLIVSQPTKSGRVTIVPLP